LEGSGCRHEEISWLNAGEKEEEDEEEEEEGREEGGKGRGGALPAGKE